MAEQRIQKQVKKAVKDSAPKKTKFAQADSKLDLPQQRVYVLTLGGEESNTGEEQPKFETVLYGADWSIGLQSSLLGALYPLLTKENSLSKAEFEDWFEVFSYQYTLDLRKDIKGKDFSPWGRPPSNRPRYLEVKSLDLKLTAFKDQVRIKFWPNREDKEDFTFFVGTYYQLTKQLDEYMRKSLSPESSESPGYFEFFDSAGFPTVTLTFRNSQAKSKNSLHIKSVINFRLTAVTDNAKKYPEKTLITKSYIEKLALDIKKAFLEPYPYILNRGHMSVKVYDPPNGMNSWVHVKESQDGINLYSKIYRLLGIDPDLTKINVSEKVDKSAYTAKPEKQVIVGRTVKTRVLRPIGAAPFRNAHLYLSTARRRILLCNHDGLLYQAKHDETEEE